MAYTLAPFPAAGSTKGPTPAKGIIMRSPDFIFEVTLFLSEYRRGLKKTFFISSFVDVAVFLCEWFP